MKAVNKQKIIFDVAANTYRKADEVVIRHKATVNNAFTVDGLHTKIALCACGRMIHNPDILDGVGSLYTDGTVYSVDCERCKEVISEGQKS